MSRTLGRAARAAAVTVIAATSLAGCHFLRPPASATASPSNKPKTPVPFNTAAGRVLDAPPILIQCIVDRGVLAPQGQDWFSNGKVTINSGNAQDFAAWWHAFLTPGPYAQTFEIDGRRTHYLAFGANWTLKNGKWVPMHRALNDPLAQRTSLYYWSQWTAEHDALPAAVCGPNANIHQLQQEIFGNRIPDPWSS